MKVAYLILAHNTPNHMRRLVRALDAPNSIVIVHVDSKSDITPFRTGLSQPNVTFLDERFPHFWGEYPIVPATLRLIEEGLKHRADYLCLLSGSDYPLRSTSYIEDFFSRNRGTEFIDLVQIPSAAVDKPMGRVTDYWVQTPFSSTLAFRVIFKLNHWLRDIGVSRDHTKAFAGLVPYAGSTWWALTADACRHIVSFVNARPELMKFMRNVYMPDESFFQIAIGNSPFAKHVTHCLTYTDWSQPVAPAIITPRHLEALAAEDVIMADDPYGRGELLFARKFPDDSEPLTAFIDRELHHRQPVGAAR